MTDTKTDKTDKHKYGDVRDRAADAYASSKEAVHRATGSIEESPFAILAGGIAIGALAGALLPRTAREKELLAPVGKRLGETARQALLAAKDAGRQELDNAGLTPSAAKDRGKDIIDGLSKAVSSAGSAAVQTARQSQSSDSSTQA